MQGGVQHASMNPPIQTLIATGVSLPWKTQDMLKLSRRCVPTVEVGAVQLPPQAVHYQLAGLICGVSAPIALLQTQNNHWLDQKELEYQTYNWLVESKTGSQHSSPVAKILSSINPAGMAWPSELITQIEGGMWSSQYSHLRTEVPTF